MFRKRYNIAIILAFLVLAGLAIYYTAQITFDFSLEIFFPKDDPDREFYNEFIERFEPDDNFLFVALENKGGVFNEAFLKKVATFTNAADTLPFVKSSASLTKIDKPVYLMGDLMSVPVLNVKDPSRYSADSVKIMNDPRFVNRFISQKGDGLNVIITTDDMLSFAQSTKLHKSLERLIGEFDFNDYHITGRSHYQVHLAKKSKSEFLTYFILLTILMIIVLALIYRRWWSVVLGILSLWMSLLIFTGFLGSLGKPLDPLASVFTVLLTIVAISDFIHITSKYIDEYNKFPNKKMALRLAIREVGVATFLTSTTTAIGFSALMVVDIPAIRKFGMFAAIGVFIAYFVVILFTTSLISLTRATNVIRHKKTKDVWYRILQWIYIITWKKRNVVAATGGVIILICIAGISMISTDTHFENHFPRDEKVSRDYKYIENHFGGARSLELNISGKEDRKIISMHSLQQIDSLEHKLQTYPSVSSVYSPATIYKSLNRAYHADNPTKYVLPQDSSTLQQFQEDKERIPQRILGKLLTENEKHGRITARFQDVGSDSSKMIIEDIRNWIDHNLDTAHLDIQTTGTYFLYEKHDRLGRKNLFQGLGLAILVISLLMALLFRNWKMVIISLLPNLIPLLIGGAIIGFSGIELSSSTAVIFAIAFGIAVDDTIHFLTKFRIERNKGHELLKAVRITLFETGKAIILTTLVLFFSFILLTTSSYPTTFYLGLLLSLTLISALLANIFLIPVFIYWMLPKDSPSPPASTMI